MRHSPTTHHWSTHPLVSFARVLLIAVLLINMLPLAQANAASVNPAPSIASVAGAASLADQPLAVQYAVSSALGVDDQGYHVRKAGAAYTAVNAQQGTQATFDPRSLQIKDGSDTWALDLAGWGRADSIQTPPAVHTTSLVDNRMEFVYGPLTAWYVNGPGGTQQGWTVQAPPAGADGQLTVALHQRGTLRGTLDADRLGLTLHDTSGVARLRYAGLMALDANNKQLPVWMELTGDEVYIRVDDRGAAYPITIDPYVASATIENPGDPANYKSGVADDRFGTSVAVSADGQTVIVGAPYANSNMGRVYVFWPGDNSPLRAVLTANTPYFGKTVAISGDGKSFLTTAEDSNYTVVLGYSVFNGIWNENRRALLPPYISPGLALNGDGTVTAIGSPSENKVYLSVVNPGGYRSNVTLDGSTQGAYYYGTSVALNADGSKLVVADPGSGGTSGSLSYHLRSDGWQRRIIGSSSGYTPQTVALSADGNTLAASSGGYYGGVDIFPWVTDQYYNSGFSSTPAARLTPSDGTGIDFGRTIGITSNGNTIVAGAPFVAAGGLRRGAVYVFNKPASGWANAPENEKLPLTGLVDDSRAGNAMAVSSVSVIVGNPNVNGYIGEIQLFNAPPRPVPAVNAISPTQKFVNSAGFTLTLSGSNFVADSVVRWNGTALPTTFVNDTTLQAQVAASLLTQPTVAPITVFTDAPGGGTSGSATFSVTTPTPVLTDVDPYFGPPAGGTSLTLTGFNLGTATSVTFGGQPATIGAKTPGSITVTTPAGTSGDVDITLVTPDGTTTMPAGFTYSSTPPPVNYRDVGAVRIWANSFDIQGDQTVAIGRVALGSTSQNAKYYQVSGSASWSSGGTITTAGAISFFDGAAFANGGATIDQSSGAATWQPGVQILIDHYGATSLVAAGPGIALNVLQPTVTVNTALLMALPENAVASARVRYTLARDGTTAAAGPGTLTLKMAGGTLSAPVQVTLTGLSASSAQLVVPNMSTFSLPGITITDNVGAQSLRIGAGGGFSIPNITLAGGTMLSLTGLTATPNLVGGKYEIALNGSLAISNFPETPTRTLALSGATIAAGKLAGNVADPQLTVGGNNLTLRSVTIQRYGQNYQLQASSASLDLPTAWGTPGNQPSATLPAVTLLASAPYLKLPNANFTVGGTLYQGGQSSALNQISFSNLSGSLNYNPTTNAFTTPLAGDINFKLGQGSDGGGVGGVQFNYANGNVSASIPFGSLGIAGNSLATGSIAYNGTSLTSPIVSLRLPSAWGGTSVTLGTMAVSNTGFTIAGVTTDNVEFAVPEVKLGPLKLANFKGHLVQVGTSNSRVKVDGQITFTKAKPSKDKANKGGDPTSASVAGSLTLRNDHVSGIIDEFAFEMSGFGFAAKGMSFSDDTMHADSVTLKLRIKSGDAEGTLSGITIGGPDEFTVGGGKFRIRDINIGKVGIQEISAEFQRTPDGSFWVSAAGKVKFPKFTVDAAIKISYDSPSDSVTINRVYLSFKGKIPSPAIAVGTTGFYMTTISGEFSLDDGTLTITLGVGGEHGLKVGDKSLLEIQGSITLQIKPEFELRSQATAKVLGYQIARVDMRINDRAFLLKGTLDAGMIHASLEVTFGLDAENEFTFYGKFAVNVTIPEGYLFSECLFSKCVNVPWNDIHIDASLEGGKFKRNRDKVWGARGSLDVLGYTANVMAILSPNTDIILGKRMYEYQPVRPQFSPAQRQLMLDAFGTNARAASTGDLYQITAGAPADRLTIIEVLTIPNRAAPTELQVAGPAGITFTKTLIATSPDGSTHIYTVDMNKPADAIGTWTFTTQAGNFVKISGAIPPPSFASATLCPTGAACVARGATATLSGGVPVQLAWNTTATYTDGLAMEAYATNSEGKRFNISHQASETERSLSGTATWTPALANGTYTVTLAVEDATSGPQQTDLAVVTFNDTTPPVAPAQLGGQATADLAALLTWNGTVAEPDVAGYQVSVDGGAPSDEDQRVAEYTVSGLTPGSTHTFAVAAYDLSGNLGPASTVTVTLPTIGLTAIWPPRNAQRTSVLEVGATFTRAISEPVLLITDATGQDVVGATSLITSAVGITQSITLGEMFVPSTALAVGSYTATIRVWDPVEQKAVTASWPFEVIDTSTPVVANPTVALASTWPTSQSKARDVNQVGAVFTGVVANPLLTLVNASGQPILGSTAPVADDTSDGNKGIVGATFTPVQTLAPGMYTATITAWDPAAEQQLTRSWSFEVVATTTTHSPHFTVYLPVVIR